MDYATLVQKANNGDYMYHKAPTDTFDSYRKAQAELDKKFRYDVVSMIMEEYGHRFYRRNLNEKMAEKIFNQAWEDSHANGHREVAWRANTLAELVDDCIFEINA